jgi:glycosyltransferase involved in cell wall biosynthesis
MTTDIDVSVVMPCLNEEDGVAECVQKALGWIEESGMTGEVVVVDNGSTDRSAELAAAAGARVVRHEEKGYGRALQRGFREARGRYLVMGDCDGTYEFGQLDPLVAPLSDGYDLVMGNRLSKQLAPGAMPWAHRFIGTPLISFVLRMFTGARITDSQCGIRGIKKESLERLGLKSPGMEFASEMILKAMREGLQMTQVDVPYYVRTGESKLSTFRDGWRHLKFLLISSPGYVFIVPGLLFLLLGVLSLAVTTFTANGVTIGSLEWEPVYAAAIFLVVGVNTLMLGVCSRLLGLREGVPPDAIVEFYRKQLGLGRLLVLSGFMAVVGLVLHVWIFIEWLNDSAGDLLATATVAASLIVIAANLAFAAVAAAMIDPEG